MTERKPHDDPREELASITASLRAYLEWQESTGASGIPRLSRGTRSLEGRSVDPAPTAGVVDSAEEREPTGPVRVAAPPPPFTEPSPSATPAAARPAATRAPTAPRDRDAIELRLAQIGDECRSCTKCGLSKTRTHAAVSRGNPHADICFIGEAPGADEDAQGVPFVGRAGQLLDRMIVAMGLDPAKDVYVVNIIKCRPPENRKPTPDEMAACFPYLHEQLALAKPKVIVALGNTAVQGLLDTKVGITKLRGEWKLYKGATPVMPTYHPSFLLRQDHEQSAAKRECWEDLQKVLRELGREVPPPKKRGAQA